MKKIQILLLAISLSVMAASCRHKGKHVTIERSNNSSVTRIEYSGRVVFTDDKTGISNMAPGSYFKYKTNYDKLIAESDDRGHITYELNGNDKTTTLNEEGKRLLADAIREIARTQGKKG